MNISVYSNLVYPDITLVLVCQKLQMTFFSQCFFSQTGSTCFFLKLAAITKTLNLSSFFLMLLAQDEYSIQLLTLLDILMKQNLFSTRSYFST